MGVEVNPMWGALLRARNRLAAEDSEGRDERRTSRRDPRTVTTAILVVVGALVVYGVATGLHLLPSLHNPFRTETHDRSGPVLLKSIQDLSRYEAAAGNFQVVVDLEKDVKWVPSGFAGDRVLFVAAGTVNAYVDFGNIGKGAITVTPDQKTATIRLPHAKLDKAALDPKHTYVVTQQRGLLNQLGDLFGGNANDQQHLYIVGQQKIQSAATQSGLVKRAETNTRLMLNGMLKSLGYTDVTVTFGNETAAPSNPDNNR